MAVLQLLGVSGNLLPEVVDAVDGKDDGQNVAKHPSDIARLYRDYITI